MTQDEISYLRELSTDLLQPTKDFLLTEICRRVAKAGKMTSTAEYQALRAKALGVEWKDIKKELARQGKISDNAIDNIFDKLSKDAIGIENNVSLLKMIKAYNKTVKNDFKSISKEMGMVAPDGKQYPIFDTFGKTMDYAFKQVFTGAQDYTSALRAATRNLVSKGIRTMPRQNAKSVTIEYAARQRLMNNLGLLNEAITQNNYDILGCDGWEISAHSASAPDHEPIQGRQYSNEVYQKINANLLRRIGTLSCKHTSSPIILGVNSPQYTDAELKAFQADNEKGITYQGRHYTLYHATQHQQSIEASIRRQKYHCLADKELGDKERLLTDQIKLGISRQEYVKFSKAAGLPTQNERTQVAGFGRSEAGKARTVYKQQNDKRAMVNITGATTQEISKRIESELSLIPNKYRALAETKISKINVTHNPKSSGYYISTKEIELSTKAPPYAIIHEYAHALERALNIINDPKFIKIRDSLLQNTTLDNIIEDTTTFELPIIRIENPRLISKYQGYIYESFGYYDGKKIWLDGMGEYFSEGFREYIVNGNNLKKHDPDLFEYMEAILRD